MGGDGGSIPGRADVVKTAGYKFARTIGGMGYIPNTQVRAGSEKYEKSEQRRLRWTRCSASQEALSCPVSVCRLGQLFSHEQAVSTMLAAKRKKRNLPHNMSHIRSIKHDLKVLSKDTSHTGDVVCSVTGTSFAGAGLTGLLMWNCGCVVTRKVFEELNGKRANRRNDLNSVSNNNGNNEPTDDAQDENRSKKRARTDDDPAKVIFSDPSDRFTDVDKLLNPDLYFQRCPACDTPFQSAEKGATNIVFLAPTAEELVARQALLDKTAKIELKKK